MICGILATTSIAFACWWLLPSVLFWIGWEIAAALLVAVGCVGEWHMIKNPAQAGHEDQHRKRELQFIAAVAVGVSMELFAIPHAILEAVRLEHEVATLNERATGNELATEVVQARIAQAELDTARANRQAELARKETQLLRSNRSDA